MLLVWLASLASAQDDCSDGEIYAGSLGQFVYTGEYLELDACGAVSSCEWQVAEPAGLGSLSSSSGLSVVWTAPSSLENCTPQDVRLTAICELELGGETQDYLELRVVCTEEEKERVDGISEWGLGGGGCTSPQYAMLALLPLAAVRRRRS